MHRPPDEREDGSREGKHGKKDGSREGKHGKKTTMQAARDKVTSLRNVIMKHCGSTQQ